MSISLRASNGSASQALNEEDMPDEVDAVGVIAALERTCELEGRLRQALQDTHPLTTTLDWDFEAADREREALLAISEQLEYLEDKLREYRFLEPNDEENKAVLLSQLDSVRRELIEVVELHARHVMFGKEVVREVLAFASVAEGGPGASGEGQEDEEEEGEEASGPQPAGAGVHPGVLRAAGHNRPPRHPGVERGGKQDTPPTRAHSAGGGTPPSHGQQLRRSYEQPPTWGAASPGATTVSSERVGSASPSAAATVAALSAATAGAAAVAGSRRHIDMNYPAENAAAQRQQQLRQVQMQQRQQQYQRQQEQEEYGQQHSQRRQASPEPEAPRSSYMAGVRASAAESGRAVAGARAGAAAQGGRILSRMDRPYTSGASASASHHGLRHEDIFGAVNGGGRPASIYNPSPRQAYGGMVRIQDMLARAEEGGQEQALAVPQRPRIYGEGVQDDDWEEVEDAAPPANPLPAHSSGAVGASPPRQRRAIIRAEESIDDETLWNGPPRMESSPPGRSHGGKERRGPGLLGQLGRLVLAGGVAAAAAVAAKHAGPVVAEKGQHALRQLQDARQHVAAQLREHQRARASAQAARCQERARHAAAQEQENRAQAVVHPPTQAAPKQAAAPAKQPGKQSQPPKQAAAQQKQPQIADMPPWLEGKPLPASAQRHPRGKVPPGAAAAAAKRSAEQQQRPMPPGHTGSRQAPVQHVAAPPRSEAFPARPSPDVSMSMG